jgi:hypothetical protein
MNTPSLAAPNRSAGRGALGLGLAFAVLGLVAYFVQVTGGHWLTVPWYLPATGTAGVVLLVVALWRRRTVVRWLVLVVLFLLAGAEGALVFVRLPAYAGPIEVGKPFPAFTTAQSDGTPFAQTNLVGKQNTIMVFFRGRW